MPPNVSCRVCVISILVAKLEKPLITLLQVAVLFEIESEELALAVYWYSSIIPGSTGISGSG